METQKDDSEKQQKDLTSSLSDYDLGASCLDKAWILHLPKCLTIKKNFTFTLIWDEQKFSQYRETFVTYLQLWNFDYKWFLDKAQSAL